MTARRLNKRLKDDSATNSGTIDEPEASQGAGKGKRVNAKGATSSQAGTSNTNTHHAVDTASRQTLARTDVTHPLDVHTHVLCKHRDGTFRPVRIIERRQPPGTVTRSAGNDSDALWEYYVHYRKLNRRMDEWVSIDRLDLDTVEPPIYIDDKGKKRRLEDDHSEEEGEGHDQYDAQQLRDHEEFTKVKNIEVIELGRYEIETWYFSPLPPEFDGCKKLYFCEYDLAFFKHRHQMLRHLQKTPILHPPGIEIYRHKGISVFEVDGAKAKTYAQNLCYMAKLFLDHKSLYNDVELFLFYIICECDDRGAHVAAYFSKEKADIEAKERENNNNLACILTLPPYQKKGLGKFMISFSYELSKLEGKLGTPERPLSDMGLAAYRGYWTRELLSLLKDWEGSVSVKQLSSKTMMLPDDIINTLNHLGLIQYQKGRHVICAAPAVIEAHLRKCGSPGLQVEPNKIVWTPYVAQKY